MGCNSLHRAMRHRQLMHTSVSMLQLSCHECKFPPSFSLLSCLQTPAPTLFCSESKTCCRFVVQVCNIIASILPWKKVAAVLPQDPVALCSSCACAWLPLPSHPSTVFPTRIPVTAEMVTLGHRDKCGPGAMPRWQQGASQVHNIHLRMFSKHKSLPLVVSFHCAVNVASDEVSVIHSPSHWSH